MKVVISGQNPEDRLRQLHDLREQLDSRLRRLDLPKERRSGLKLAATEMVINPLKHNEGGEEKIIFLAYIHLPPNATIFAIRCWGYEQEHNLREIQNALDSNISAAPDAENKRGLDLVKKLLPGAKFFVEFGQIAVAFPICPLLGQSYQFIQPPITVVAA